MIKQLPQSLFPVLMINVLQERMVNKPEWNIKWLMNKIWNIYIDVLNVKQDGQIENWNIVKVLIYKKIKILSIIIINIINIINIAQWKISILYKS